MSPRRIGSESEEDFAVGDALAQLSAVSYQYKRESIMSGSNPDVDAFVDKVQKIFRRFCEDCGFANITEFPELDARKALTSRSCLNNSGSPD